MCATFHTPDIVLSRYLLTFPDVSKQTAKVTAPITTYYKTCLKRLINCFVWRLHTIFIFLGNFFSGCNSVLIFTCTKHVLDLNKNFSFFFLPVELSEKDFCEGFFDKCDENLDVIYRVSVYKKYLKAVVSVEQSGNRSYSSCIKLWLSSKGWVEIPLSGRIVCVLILDQSVVKHGWLRPIYWRL